MSRQFTTNGIYFVTSLPRHFVTICEVLHEVLPYAKATHTIFMCSVKYVKENKTKPLSGEYLTLILGTHHHLMLIPQKVLMEKRALV